MLALVRIQMCSLLILACRAVLLPGNYTARAGRQTDFQLTALKGERVFSNFFFPSISSKSEPARKLWREALVFICASQAEYDGQALSPGLGYPAKFTGSQQQWGSLEVECEQPVGQWRPGLLTGYIWGTLPEVGVTSTGQTCKSRSRVPDAHVVTRYREHHTLVPRHWRTEAHTKNAWLNQDVLRCTVAYWELPLLKDIRDTFWTGSMSHLHSALPKDVK